MKKQQSGFTLIELVAVIVLLGVLAVTALPALLDLEQDARREILDSLTTAMKGANTQVLSGSLIQGNRNADNGFVSSSAGSAIATTYGFISGSTTAMNNALDLDSAFDTSLSDTGHIHVGYTSLLTPGAGCYVRYESASSGTGSPTYSAGDTTSC